MDTNLKGKVAIVTGAAGAICGEIAQAFAGEGASVALWDIRKEAAQVRSEKIGGLGGIALAVQCAAMNRESVENATRETIAEFGRVDILVNGAGGSRKEATTMESLEFFDLNTRDMDSVFALNYLSAVIPSQVVGRQFACQKQGVILNISSIAGIRPLTRAISYSNAKAANNSFTQWLAVHMAQIYSPQIRVNAIAPGFMLTEQNHFLLVESDSGKPTARGERILDHCPMKRYGIPSEVVGAALWLASDSASFVTGAVIPVDGGFTAYCGV